MISDPKKQAGQRGEMKTIEETKKLGSSYLRINSKRMSLGPVSQSAEYDHIIIGNTGIFIIDSKSWAGSIEFTNPGAVQTKPNGEVVTYDATKDMTAQLEHQCYVMRQALIQVGLHDVEIHGIICFTSPSAVLINDNPKFKAIKVSELNAYIQAQNKSETLTFEQQTTILNFILDKSKDSEAYNEEPRISATQSGANKSTENKTSLPPVEQEQKFKEMNKAFTSKWLLSLVTISLFLLGSVFFILNSLGKDHDANNNVNNEAASVPVIASPTENISKDSSTASNELKETQKVQSTNSDSVKSPSTDKNIANKEQPHTLSFNVEERADGKIRFSVVNIKEFPDKIQFSINIKNDSDKEITFPYQYKIVIVPKEGEDITLNWLKSYEISSSKTTEEYTVDIKPSNIKYIKSSFWVMNPSIKDRDLLWTPN